MSLGTRWLYPGEGERRSKVKGVKGHQVQSLCAKGGKRGQRAVCVHVRVRMSLCWRGVEGGGELPGVGPTRAVNNQAKQFSINEMMGAIEVPNRI